MIIDTEGVYISSMEAYYNRDRRIFSRGIHKYIEIIKSIEPGDHSYGCFVCCNAPTCCPACSICPCYGDAEYVEALRKASTYILLREHSIEWNEPVIMMKPGQCLGVDPCLYEVQDKVKVVYFDDIMFDRITDQTRFCNECRTCFCGGKGERVRIDSPICFNCCQRGSAPCLCIPICCPKFICPCVLRHEIYMKDAQKGVYDIKKIRDATLEKLTHPKSLNQVNV